MRVQDDAQHRRVRLRRCADLRAARECLQICARVCEDDHGLDGLRGKQIRRDRTPVLREQRHRVDVAHEHGHGDATGSCR